MVSRCPFCLANSETQDHVLFNCANIRPIWAYFSHILQVRTTTNMELRQTLMLWWLGGKGGNTKDKLIQCMPGIIVWHIWKSYNDCTWEDKQFSRASTINSIKDYSRKWIYTNQHKKWFKFDEELYSDGLIPYIRKNHTSQILRWKNKNNLGLILNTDAAYFPHISAGGSILREACGTFKSAIAFPLSSMTPLQAEMLAIQFSSHELVI
ncbi:unnamed protein product [Cuscuta epithymum]|uniref:Reverse transcriptase zinc-binding domain-containing protein n=1 Tax=Cuscuta epithymum TaxID=186058 RepID=A0AAV0CL65_9ASTE|nr:unnamed protein product [Cuscuta epithymum]